MPFEIVVLQVGNYIPISPVRDDVAAAYKKGMEWKASKMLLPYKQLCSEKKVEAEIVQIEADDVPVAISNEVSKSQISMLVIGASLGGNFTRCFVRTQVLFEAQSTLYNLGTLHFLFYFSFRTIFAFTFVERYDIETF
ncbi:hypothetical protein Syun_019132 [Stephania yunnanensis]|uniref:RING-type E3 ubiquitin transferase n=1 Tax=Stephania yunnanensis TaxID=152371 RepID=A0AAP0IUP3_9MAGN